MQGHSTERYILFTDLKLGSTYIKRYFEYPNNNKLPMYERILPSISVNPNTLELSFNENDFSFKNLNHKKFYTDVKNILEKKSNKDVIILLRNPKLKFISAFIQDYIKPHISKLDDDNYIKEFIKSTIKEKFENTEYEFYSNHNGSRISDWLWWIPFLDDKKTKMYDIDKHDISDILVKHGEPYKNIKTSTEHSKKLNKFMFDILLNMKEINSIIDKNLIYEKIIYNYFKL